MRPRRVLQTGFSWPLPFLSGGAVGIVVVVASHKEIDERARGQSTEAEQQRIKGETAASRLNRWHRDRRRRPALGDRWRSIGHGKDAIGRGLRRSCNRGGSAQGGGRSA